MIAKIEQASNGFVVTLDDDGHLDRQVLVFEDHTDREGFVNLLWSLVDFFDQRGSRYDAHRVTVGTEPGDKYTP